MSCDISRLRWKIVYYFSNVVVVLLFGCGGAHGTGDAVHDI